MMNAVFKILKYNPKEESNEKELMIKLDNSWSKKS